MESYMGPLERGIIYTTISSSGFLISIVICNILLRIVGQGSGSRGLGRFGKFMMMIEAMDAIPESIVLANCSVEDNMSWAFLVAISVSNLVLSTSTCFDLMATNGSRNLHRLLMSMNMVGAGMLVYSVPVQTFQVFKSQSMKRKDHYWAYGIGWISGGALAGVAFMLVMNMMEEKVMSSPLMKMDKKIDRKGLSSMLRDIKRHMESCEDSKNEAINDSEKFVVDSMLLGYENLRKEKISRIMEDLDRGIKSLEGDSRRHWISEPLEDTMDEEALSSFTSPEGSSLMTRTLIVFALFLSLFLWSICLTSLFAMVFVWLKRDHESMMFYGDSLAEGISAGSFLGSLSGTIIPRLMQDAYGSEWTLLGTKMCSMSFFMIGITVSVSLDMFESFTGPS